MPRMARLLIDGGTYHVLSRGNNGQAVFHEEADHQRYLRLLLGYAQTHGLTIYHFALMPNHVHLVLQVSRAPELSKAMSGLNLAYALFYRRRYQYRGHLWQDRFKSLLIDRDSYLLECGRYVELNPVRAGLARDPREYSWTSYRVYAEGADNPLIAANPLYLAMGGTAKERQAQYQEFVHDGIRRGLAAPLTRYQFMAGTSAAMRDFELQFGVPARRRGPGRPRKVPVEVVVQKNENRPQFFQSGGR